MNTTVKNLLWTLIPLVVGYSLGNAFWKSENGKKFIPRIDNTSTFIKSEKPLSDEPYKVVGLHVNFNWDQGERDWKKVMKKATFIDFFCKDMPANVKYIEGTVDTNSFKIYYSGEVRIDSFHVNGVWYHKPIDIPQNTY